MSSTSNQPSLQLPKKDEQNAAAGQANGALPFGRKMLYSLASAGLNILSITTGTWLLYFYSPPPDSGRIQYLPASLVGVLLFVISLWDALIDPFIGHFSDTLRSRWGRRRPFLIFGAPAVAILMVLLWTPPQHSNTTITALYFLMITMAFFTAFSLVGIPYDGTLPEMAPDSKKRVDLSYWKNVFGLAGVLVGSLIAAPLFESWGAPAMGILVGAISLITIWSTLAGLRESRRPSGEPMTIIAGLRATLRNRQFIFVFVSTLFIHIAYQILVADLPYFITLVIGQSESEVALYQGVLILVMAATGPFWSLASRKVPQSRLLSYSMVGLTIFLALGFTVGVIPGWSIVAQGLIMVALVGAALGGYFIIVYAMMGNVVDYDEMLTGRRREAIYYGTFSLALGIGIAAGTLILPLALDNLGYTRQNPLGVRFAFLICAFFTLLGYAVFQGYKLGDTPEETKKKSFLFPVSGHAQPERED